MASRQLSDAQQVPPGSVLLVIHDFIARSPDELSLAKGDRIELIERDDDFGDGWFLGRHMNNGNTGLFPEVYTTPAPKGTLQVSSRPSISNSIPGTDFQSKQSSDTIGNAQSISSKARDSANEAFQKPDSSSGAQTHALRTSLPANSQQPRSLSQVGPHNSVMHETLSVIDEHITDMRSTPRQSYLGGGRGQAHHDTDSVYSSHMGDRFSYMNGHHTDDDDGDEQQAHTEDEVIAWTPAHVAEYLEENGVEREHCQIFREQEISGEVLLHMEQSAIFIKEFELGSVGRRLKTWQKVKALQDEVRSTAGPSAPRSVSDYSGVGDDSTSDTGRRGSNALGVVTSRLSTTTSAPTAHPIQNERASTMHQRTLSGMTSPLQAMTSMTSRPDSTVRPSAASIRSMNHTRRHSSVGSIDSNIPSATFNRSSMYGQLSSSAVALASAARRTSSAQDHTLSAGPSRYDGPSVGEYGFGTLSSPTDIDRGYFSGNEVDNRNKRNVLHKRSSPTHTRTASAVTDSARHSVSYKAYDRMTSTESLRDPALPPPSATSNAFGFLKTGGNRTVSSPQMTGKPASSPIVTKLEYRPSPAPAGSETSSLNPTPSPASHNFSFFGKPRAGGLRVASDAVTQNEKRTQSALKGSPITSPTRTGSTTPSTDTPSIEVQKADMQSRVSTGSSSALAPPAAASRARPKPKSKQTTSAYTKGLEKKTPAEQMVGCDYSGWMKKKSSNLISSWKPRLFVLRGRRLSYYYSETDTEEKGLIDIASHRVLPAENEKITGLHAALTGASSSPMAPQNATTKTSAATDLAAHPPLHPTTDQALFIFKLVPPRQGLSKAVNFTKPTVHYFAVNSRQEGRLWMAALMKATIDYDSGGNVTTSYNQNTISLAKARARMERPPALKEAGSRAESDAMMAELEGDGAPGSEGNSKGLGIGGLATPDTLDDRSVITGAEREENNGSIANGSVNSAREREAAPFS